MPVSVDDFLTGVAADLEDAAGDVVEEQQRLGALAAKRLAEETPAVTGRSRSTWRATVNPPRQRKNSGPVISAAQVGDRAKKSLRRLKPGKVVYVTSTAAHMPTLDEKHGIVGKVAGEIEKGKG